ncbi:MAG: TlpA family protein disulfide reductase [Firmicutes bacterium]|nr:TlpA family protein disulfide reductase [Bacillota bacterium]
MKRSVLFKSILTLVLMVSLIALSACDGDTQDKDLNMEDEQNEDNMDVDNSEEENQDSEEEESDGYFQLEIGKELPNFQFENLQGEMVSLEDQRGKNVLVNIWATTCHFCRGEMDDFQKYYSEYKDENFTILAVDVGEPLKQVKEYIEENSYDFPVLLDQEGELYFKYGLQGVPTSIIVDKEGIIRGIRLGAMEYPELKQRFDALQ